MRRAPLGLGLAVTIFMVAACQSEGPVASADRKGLSTAAHESGVVVVHPGDMKGWAFAAETGDGVGQLVTGPASPPSGSGSANFVLDDGLDGHILAYGHYQGTRLDQIDDLAYSTYRSSGGAALGVALQFNIHTDLTDGTTGWQGRLVYEPYYTHGVTTGAWQTWDPQDDAANGNWWFTGAPGNVTCPMSNPCTWSEVLGAFPDAGIHATLGAVILKAGSGWSSFDGNVDALTISVSGTSTTYDFELEADDEGPITTNVLADPNPVQNGTPFTLTADVDDTATGGSTIASAEYSLDGGSWTAMGAADGTFDGVLEGVTAEVDAPAIPGIYDLCVRGTDEPGNMGLEECTMLVVYDPSGGFVTGGGWIDSPAGAYMPADDDVVTESDIDQETDLAIDWLRFETAAGNGTFVNGPGLPPLGTGSFEMTSTAGSDKVTLFNYDHIGTLLADIESITYATYRSSASTNNAAQYPALNIQVDFVGDGSSFTTLVWEPIYPYGPGALQTDAWQTWDAMAASQTAFAGGWWSTAAIPGVCAFNCFVSWETIVTNNPDAKIKFGFGVNIGSGWNGTFSGNVDALALVVGGVTTTYDFEVDAPADPVGKANFGFVSKYKKGASIPDGNTEFVFQNAGLNFHSTSYDWLVINQGGANAQFKGWGTVNGAGAYEFMLWAGDGTGPNGEDTFRIKIGDDIGGVVYDNGMHQPIGGGSIKVHKK